MNARANNRMAEAYATYAPGATRAAYFLVGDREVAHDIVQDAFVRILGRFGSRRQPEKFQAYLHQTIVNLSRNHLRRRGLERMFVQRGVPASSEPDPGTDDEMWQALQTLPHRQRTALVLRYYLDMSEREAADAMGCSDSAVNSLVTRGLASLRGQLASIREVT